MLISSLSVIIGLALLIYSSDKFIDGAASVAEHSKVSPLVIGLLILGFGTSAPEIMVSIFAALADEPELALGNAIGSNIANIALVLGVTAIIANVEVKSSILKLELPILIVANIITAFLMLNNYLSFIDGLILISLLVVVLTWMIKSKNNQDHLDIEISQSIIKMPIKSAWLWTISGLILLIISSKLLVWGAENIANALGVSDLVIGLTIIAIGTSLPELATSITAVLKNKHDMAIGNVIGSNLFNLLAVIGIAAVIRPFEISPIALYRDFLIMFVLTVYLFIDLILGKNTLTRKNGILLSASFVAYLVLLFYTHSF